MVIKVIGDVSNIQSDIDFYSRICSISNVKSISELTREYRKSFAGTVIETFPSNIGKAWSGKLSETKESNNVSNIVQTTEDKGKYTDTSDIENVLNVLGIPLDGSGGIELEDEEIIEDFPEDEEDFPEDESEDDEGFDDWELGGSEEEFPENDEDDDFPEDEEPYDIGLEEGTLADFPEDEFSDDEEDEVVEDDTEEDFESEFMMDDEFEDGEEYEDDMMDMWGNSTYDDSDSGFSDSSDDLDFNKFIATLKENRKDIGKDIENTVEPQKAAMGRISLNSGKSDDSWRSSSEVGTIQNLWSFDEMEDASPEVVSQITSSMNKFDTMYREANPGPLQKEMMVSMETRVREAKVYRESKKVEEKPAIPEELEVSVIQQKVEKVEAKEIPKYEDPVVKEVEVQKGSYRTVRDLVKKNPNCTIEFALEYFSKKELEKEIKTGRIFKSRNKLFI